jgi:hypothetical protein
MQTDYFIKGAGASAMAFVDVMLRETDATFTIVDKRAAPGGHWNDAYPFVRLHQPSASYGVPSRPLGHMRKDITGFNQGFYEQASGIEVADYYHQLMRDTFLPSGRVSYYPVSEVLSDDSSRTAEFVSLLSGERQSVQINKKFVDATILNTEIPLTHTRKFEAASDVTCIPPNDLTRIAPKHMHFTVLGAGKTGIDSVLWLLANSAKPEAITWVLPRDPWLINRAHFQPGEENFEQSMGALANQNEIAANATSLQALCEGMEAKEIWLRLDTSVWPTMIHGATVNLAELEQLRRVGRLIRKQHVRRLEPGNMILDSDAVASHPNELYVDCTASALASNVHDRRPVFSSGVIRLHMIRQYQPTFSAAFIGHIEAAIADEAEKVKLTQIAPMTDTVQDWAAMMVNSMTNQGNWAANKELVNWMANCRLDLYSGQVKRVKPEDVNKIALLTKMREHAGPAVRNLYKLVQAGR